MTTKTDARSITTTYAYDALNRMTQRSYSDSTPAVSYFYDNLTNAKGKLTKVSSSVSTTEYTAFDILGRVTGHKQTTDGQEYATGYVYNLSGAMVEQVYPSGRVVKNVLDANGDLSMVQSARCGSTHGVSASCSNPHGYWNYAQNFTYNPAGTVTSMQLGNGRWESMQYNSRLQPTQIALGTVQNGYDKLRLQYGYGTTANNGNVLSQTITVNRPSQSDLVFDQLYSYDSLNRITSAEEKTGTTVNWNQTYTFDRYGNRNFNESLTTTLPKGCMDGGNPAVCVADRNVMNPTLNAANNRMATGQGWAYDAAGNVTTDAEGRTFTYDGENKQIEVKNSLNATVGQYFFDGDGKRVKKVVPSTGEITVFVYDAGAKLIGEYSTIVQPVQDAKAQYLTNDHLGSPRIKTDRDGAVISRNDYLPYGEDLYTAQRTAALAYDADTVRKQFTGYERDTETDLNFAQARYQVASLGRFSSPDPLILSARLAFPQTWNRYIYVLNNPCSQFDPEGLYPSPAFNCSETVTNCLNDEQRRILTESKVKVGKETLSGEALYNALTEKQQNAFVNVTDKLASYATKDGTSLLASVKSVTEFRNDRIFATVDKNIGSNLNESSEFSRANASQHVPFDSSSFKSNDSTLGNIQISLNSSGTGADIDIDIGNVKSGDIAGPVIHFFEVVRNKLFKKQTGQDTVRRILIADPKVQTVTPSSDPKFNRRPR